MFDYYLIIAYLSVLFGLYIFIYSYNYFVDMKYSISKIEIIIILIVSIFMVLNNLYNFTYLKVPVTIFIITIFFLVLYRNSFYKSLFLSNFILLISLISEVIMSILASLIIKDMNVLNNSIFLKFSFTIIYLWCFYYMYKIPVFKFIYKKTFSAFKKKKEIIVFIYIFLYIIGCMYVLSTLDYKDKSIYIYGIITIILFIFVIILYLKEIHSNQILNIKNKYLIENEVIFKNNLDDFRMLKHNLLNDFLFISSMCPKEIQSIIKEKTTKYNVNLDNYNDISNLPEGLQGILYYKSSIAKKQNIEFYIDGNSKFKTKKLGKRVYIDLCEIIGIVIDNAIEAIKDSKTKAIYFKIFSNKNNIKIDVLNTYNNDIDLNLIGNKNYSTKKRNSGLGLYHIQKLNKNIEIKKSIINDLFKIEIITKIK